MFDHILVPLDGSGLAEAAITPAVVLSKQLGSQITLLHVIEKNAPQEIHGQRHLTTESEALAYLDRIKDGYLQDPRDVRIHVHTEESSAVAKSIVDHSEEYKPDLIILSAHGEGGLRDIVIGSIPQQVISAGSIPVLLLQPQTGNEYREIKFRRFLVPLDDDREHEFSLTVAADLALKTGASLHLVTIIPTLASLNREEAMTAALLPISTNAILDITEENACEALEKKVPALEARGLKVSVEVERGDPAGKVIESSLREHVDLIVLSTHQKKGLEAFWAGSVAPNIVSHTQLPLLLLPIHK